MSPFISEPLLTVHDVARLLRVSGKTVRRRIAAGELDAVRTGRDPRAPYRVEPAAVERLLHGGRKQA